MSENEQDHAGPLGSMPAGEEDTEENRRRILYRKSTAILKGIPRPNPIPPERRKTKSA